MSPSVNQLANLSRMASILNANYHACMLAHSLWEFFNFRLHCSIHANDGQPSTHHIDLPDKGEPLRIGISLRQSHRQEEALVHELLHANLIPLGYPTFRIWESSDWKWRLAGGIINMADHVIMLPVFLSFGYSRDRFLGAGTRETRKERRISAKIDDIASNLSTPESYLTEISACLSSERITFEPIYLANAVLRSPSTAQEAQ